MSAPSYHIVHHERAWASDRDYALKKEFPKVDSRKWQNRVESSTDLAGLQ